MTKWWLLAAVGIAGLALGFLLGLWGPFRGPRTAMVDLERVFTESPLAREYQEKLNAEIKARDEALKKIADPKERQTKREEYGRELTELQQKYRNEVLAALDKVLAESARRRGVEVVYARGTILRYAAVDLTEEAIRRLK